MTIDVDRLLESFGEDAPSGPDTEYDQDFVALAIAATPQEELAVGESVIEAEEPDYRDVRDKALELLGRTRDLRVAVHLALAALRLEGFPGFADVLNYMRGSLEQYWDSVHPQLDPDDDNDPTMRVNAVRDLTGNDTFLRAVRLAPLTDSRAFGRFCLRDIQLVRGEISPADGEQIHAENEIEAAFEDTPEETRARIAAALSQSDDHLRAIEAVFDEQVPAQGPDLAALRQLLHEARAAIAPHLAAGEAEETGETGEREAAAAPGGPARPAPARGGAPGAIETREDVCAAIDRICAYYSANEPSSPVPFLLQRARRLVAADFQTILRDMAPEGYANFALVAGIEEEEEE